MDGTLPHTVSHPRVINGIERGFDSRTVLEEFAPILVDPKHH
jgi:hypothetical protein